MYCVSDIYIVIIINVATSRFFFVLVFCAYFIGSHPFVMSQRAVKIT